jgi:hypothetical protein
MYRVNDFMFYTRQRSGDLADRQEHRQGLRAVAEGALNRLKRSKAQLAIEGDCGDLGVDDDANAAEAIPHLKREPEGKPQQQLADAATSRTMIHGKARNPQDGQGVVRQPLSGKFGNGCTGYFARTDRDKAEYPLTVDGDVGVADVVPELVLPGIPLKEAIQLDVAAAETGSVIRPCQRADDDLSHPRASVRAGPRWAVHPIRSRR